MHIWYDVWIPMKCIMEQISAHFLSLLRMSSGCAQPITKIDHKMPQKIYSIFCTHCFQCSNTSVQFTIAWWCHQIEAFSALLTLFEGNSVTGRFSSQRPVMWNFDVFFDQCLNKRLSNNWNAGDFRCHHARYDITVIEYLSLNITFHDPVT